jgi:hypothetical protein
MKQYKQYTAEEWIAVAHELAEFNRLCPYYCDGSRRGIGAYLDGVVARTGISLERVSYAWRTTLGMLSFLAALSDH